MRVFDFVKNVFIDERANVKFFDLTKTDDTSERITELEEQLIIMNYKGVK